VVAEAEVVTVVVAEPEVLENLQEQLQVVTVYLL
jgi:hypothetical protein